MFISFVFDTIQVHDVFVTKWTQNYKQVWTWLNIHEHEWTWTVENPTYTKRVLLNPVSDPPQTNIGLTTAAAHASEEEASAYSQFP